VPTVGKRPAPGKSPLFQKFTQTRFQIWCPFLILFYLVPASSNVACWLTVFRKGIKCSRPIRRMAPVRLTALAIHEQAVEFPFVSNSANTSSALLLSGTTWILRHFDNAAGIHRTRVCRSMSAHLALSASFSRYYRGSDQVAIPVTPGQTGCEPPNVAALSAAMIRRVLWPRP
jgi:hypothetical protein